MSDPVHTSSPPAELTQLAEQKRQEAQDIKAAAPLKNTWAAMKGAIGGFTAGVIGYVASAAAVGSSVFMRTVKNSHGSMDQFTRDIERMSPAARERATQELAERTTQNMLNQIEHSSGILETVMRHPGVMVAGATVLGGAALLSSQSEEEKKKAQKVEKELAQLEKVEQSWREKVLVSEAHVGCGGKLH